MSLVTFPDSFQVNARRKGQGSTRRGTSQLVQAVRKGSDDEYYPRPKEG